LILSAAAFAGCGGDDDSVNKTVDELQDPATCMECHPKHVQQWTASMHAYASIDPVFVAMNKRGQRETSNQLGTFCVKCHAPMAVELGLTDGITFDPAALPAKAQGVTCYFCHNVKSITDTHNNGLVLANDQTMRGGVSDPVKSAAHRSSYDPLMDSTSNDSEMCGSCHDVVTPRGVELERTFKEWKTTFFADHANNDLHHLTCGSCHMASSTGTIADAPGVISRQGGVHEHLWPAIDQALSPFPGTDAMAAGIKRDLDGAISVIGPSPLTSPVQPGGICLDPQGKLTVRIDSIGTGHDWPSGAAQDRRAWLEVVAYDAETGGNVVFHSGTNADGSATAGDPDALNDPTLFGLWDRTKKDDGSPAHFFWDVATVDSQLLRPPVSLDKNSPLFDHSSMATFMLPGLGVDFTKVLRIETKIRIRPLSYAMVDDLIGSGDLDPGVRGQLQTLDILGSKSTWLKSTAGTGPALGTRCNPQ
ncbi:MAG TPA: multiheme c-type cytochrome, partial [Kofleriaceae bacterium]